LDDVLTTPYSKKRMLLQNIYKSLGFAGTCERGNELSGSIKYGEFLDQLKKQLASQEGLCSVE
jgi:hypothetical protein